jgi:hypothetical protein
MSATEFKGETPLSSKNFRWENGQNITKLLYQTGGKKTIHILINKHGFSTENFLNPAAYLGIKTKNFTRFCVSQKNGQKPSVFSE